MHTIAGLKDRAGGVARSVPGLCESLSREGCRVVLVTQSPAGLARDDLRLPDPSLVDLRLVAGWDWQRLRVSYTPDLARKLAAVCAEVRPDVLHDHGLWLQMNHAAAAIANRLGIRRVVSPRGMLEDWAFSYRGLKKRIAWSAYQFRDLQGAAAFCATSHLEARSIRGLGFTQPIAVIPNGIDLPEVPVDSGGPRRGTRTLVFMSRLHPKKGLLDLVAAWSRISDPGWRLVIAGPDEDGYKNVVQASIDRFGQTASVRFSGSVAGAAKKELMATADLFVLPSYSENFGIVVGEALSYGVPVITTTSTPWRELVDEACGWWIATGADALERTLRAAMSMSVAERAEMGRRGRRLVMERYSWQVVARKHTEFYEWVAGRGSQPDCLAA